MKNMFLKWALAAGLTLAVGLQAAEGKVREIKGKMVCAKCALHKTDKCQNALVVKHGDRQVVYYLEGNKVSKAFHKNVCEAGEEGKQVVVKGTVKREHGKNMLTATEIKPVPE